MLDEGARASLDSTRFTDVRWFGDIDSTNRYLLDEARSGTPEGVVAVADHQSAGRGRLGRTWTAPPAASLLMSVLLRPQAAPEHLHLLNASVAMAAADACARIARVQPALKWPNDLMVGSRKLAGVLAEAVLAAEPAPGRRVGPGPGRADGKTVAAPAVVVGVGLNVNWPEELPEELRDRVVALSHLGGRPVDRVRLLVTLLQGLEERRRLFDSPAGRAELGEEYRSRCDTVGRQVRVELTGETLEGVAVDLTPEGHLVLQGSWGSRRLTAGDVTHLHLT